MKKRGMLKKMFLSYIGLLVPMFFVLLLAFYGITSEYKQLDDKRLELAVGQVMDTIELKYLDLMALSTQIANLSDMTPSVFLKGESYIASGIKFLQDISSYDDLISDSFVYYANDKVYSIKGSSSIDTYINRTLNCDAESGQFIRELIKNRERDSVFTQSDRGIEYLVFHFPTGISEEEKRNSVNFCINVPDISNLLTPLLQIEELYVRMELENGQCLYLNGNSTSGFLQIDSAGYPEMQGSKHWIIKNSLIDNMGTTFQFAWSYEAIYANVRYYQIGLYLIMTLLLLMAGAISFRISYNYWKKTRKVVEIVGDKYINQDGQARQDEWGMLSNAVGGIVEENQKSMTMISEYQKVIKQQISMAILHGTYNSIDQIDQMLDLCKLDFYEENYAVVLLSIPGTQLKEVEDFFSRYYADDIYCVDIVSGKSVFELLLQLPNEDLDGKARKLVARKLAEKLETQNIAIEAFRCIVSDTYTEKHMIPYAWMEALEKLQDSFNQAALPDAYICTNDYIYRSMGDADVDPDIVEFGNAIRKQDSEKAVRILKKVVRNLNGLNHNKVYYRCFCLLRHMIFSLQNSEREVDPSVYENVMKINLGDQTSFLEEMTEAVEYYCNQKNTTDFDKILEYIHENYMRNDLSLDEISDEFHLSKTLLSRVFKKNTECKYIDYLSNLRMEEAKKELIETDFSIQQIAENVGYIDVPGFRKKFKRTYGINASQYRKEHTDKSN